MAPHRPAKEVRPSRLAAERAGPRGPGPDPCQRRCLRWSRSLPRPPGGTGWTCRSASRCSRSPWAWRSAWRSPRRGVPPRRSSPPPDETALARMEGRLELQAAELRRIADASSGRDLATEQLRQGIDGARRALAEIQAARGGPAHGRGRAPRGRQAPVDRARGRRREGPGGRERAAGAPGRAAARDARDRLPRGRQGRGVRAPPARRAAAADRLQVDGPGRARGARGGRGAARGRGRRARRREGGGAPRARGGAVPRPGGHRADRGRGRARRGLRGAASARTPTRTRRAS